ncbi:MAG TPA: hypothetical protein VMW27_05265 [Thermoanaerobaculia bacterium]|nr:hypothetical protein [Thermoanaerobaculia bacterium]
MRDERWRELAVTFRIIGGVPSQGYFEELELEGIGTVKGRLRDELTAQGPLEAVHELNEADTRELLQALASGLGKLTPQASFIPDSLVGSVIVRIEDRAAAIYFDPEETDPTNASNLPPEIEWVLEELRKVFDKSTLRR